MRHSKLFLSLFMVFITTSAFAQEVTPPTPLEKTESILIATVNIYKAAVVSQTGNKVTVSFDLANREGAQPQVKYGIELLRETKDGQIHMDEKAYGETLSLSENSQVHKEIIYEAPGNLKGEYAVYVTSKNTSGFPLAIAYAGKIMLEGTEMLLEVPPESCFLQVKGEKGSPDYTLIQGVDIASTEEIILRCTGVNNSNNEMVLIPHYETYYRSLYGEKVSHEGGSNDALVFKPHEKKDFSLTLPKASKPQAYDIKFVLAGTGASSQPITIHYVLQGVSATIQNIILDKDQYQKGETANLSFIWTQSADNFPESRAGKGTSISEVILSIAITDANQKECAAPIKQVVPQNVINPKIIIPIPIIESCVDPRATIVLEDEKGEVLDKKSFIVETKKSTSPVPLVVAVVGVIVVIIFAGVVLYRKNTKNNETANQ